jgi:hypothetical protein
MAKLRLGKVDQRSDAEKRREGAWMKWPWDDELAFRVRRSNEDVVQRGVRRLRKEGELEVPDAGKQKDAGDDQDQMEQVLDQYDVVIKQLAQPKVLAHVLVTDWRGVYDGRGKVEYDADKAEEVFSDPDYGHLCRWIAEQSILDRHYRKEAEEEGNSSPPASGGKSGGGGKSKKTKGSGG